MSRQNIFSPFFGTSSHVKSTSDKVDTMPYPAVSSTEDNQRKLPMPSFWHDRFVEAGMILSMGLYYIVGNPNINIHLGPISGIISHLNPLFSLPFLFIFALLCWYRLPFAIALMPLTLPYYLLQKVVVNNYRFSLVEITLAVCVTVALGQLLLRRRRWRYWLSWAQLRDRLGPFALPILVFFVFAAISIGIAYSHTLAVRAFREEVFDPLLYLLLALACLRSRQDVTRLLASLLGTALIIALLGMAQYFLFKNTLVLESDGIRRVHTVYGSANNVGLLFDYTLPFGIALLLWRVSWTRRLLALVICLPIFFVLYLTQSIGAWIAIPLSVLFVLALSIRNTKLLLIAGLTLVIIGAGMVAIFQKQLDTIVLGHTNQQGYNTVTKRLYLWESALAMINDSPWLGYGMDNWLCHYSYSKWAHDHHPCNNNLHHYWILTDPVTGKPTGMSDEPTLSHPHNIFLHVWVSMGVFGLLAFVAVLILFYWLFARILAHLRRHAKKIVGSEHLRWMVVGVGAAMLAALLQGQGDSSFLEQDLAFCFWMLVSALLLLRVLSATLWREKPLSLQKTS